MAGAIRVLHLRQGCGVSQERCFPDTVCEQLLGQGMTRGLVTSLTGDPRLSYELPSSRGPLTLGGPPSTPATDLVRAGLLGCPDCCWEQLDPAPSGAVREVEEG